MNGFHAEQVLPGVWHITDRMGVCMTLLKGTDCALLVDTGYGLDDVQTFVRTFTNLPLTVLLTHAHHDHILGARWFESTCMLKADLADFAEYTSVFQRTRVQQQAHAKGLQTPEDFLTAPIPLPQGIEPCTFGLGGLTAQIIACPGHTPGSAVVYVSERQLLLTGDDWNPCTWLFFEQALPVEQYRDNMQTVQKLPFTHVLCSHQPVLFERQKLDDYLHGLTDENLQKAHPVDMGRPVDTREVHPASGQNLVFDWGKSALSRKGEKSMKQIDVTITPESRAKFSNNAAYCVGTGRMGLALHKEYLDQLAMAQELAHFKHIRGHGLFCDDMAIYQPYTDAEGVEHEGYCFTYLDRVVDSYLALGVKPFLELGFMPKRMASGKQTIFYWEGNTTPPADHDKWARMVKATLRHLADRYGEEEVSAWPCEVWNEPNLPGFWENADREKYLHLYKVTSKAVKEALPNMRVGGPAICGGESSLGWMEAFLEFCRDEQLPLDFITRHAYMAQTPQRVGKYMYHEMCAVENTLDEMQRTRDIIDSYPEFRGMEMHITEFNTSYNPLCPIHDTNLNAAYIAGLLGCLGDVAASYSYWTFGDVFEECGVPTRPFHGGFGMIANSLIPKPTMWTFAFFNNLKGECVYRDANVILMRRSDGSYEGVAWNLCREKREALDIRITLPENGMHTVLTRVVDEECCNPLKAWHEMGEPASLTREQLQFLREASQPLSTSVLTENVALILRPNAVMHFTISAYHPVQEYGYDYQWYLTHA